MILTVSKRKTYTQVMIFTILLHGEFVRSKPYPCVTFTWALRTHLSSFGYSFRYMALLTGIEQTLLGWHLQASSVPFGMSQWPQNDFVWPYDMIDYPSLWSPSVIVSLIRKYIWRYAGFTNLGIYSSFSGSHTLSTYSPIHSHFLHFARFFSAAWKPKACLLETINQLEVWLRERSCLA